MSTSREGLARRLTLWDAVAIHVGIILGSGIFVAPDDVAAAFPGLYGLLPWILGGAIATCGAFVYAECAVRIPETGGFFNYYRAALGEAPAFVAGWAGYVATYPASMGAIARVFGDVLPQAVPGVPQAPRLYAALALATVGGLNVAGVRLSASVQRVLTGGKVLAIAAVVLAAVAAAPHGTPTPSTIPAQGGGFAALSLAALVAVLWAYDGWSDVTLVAGEVKEPGRNIGRTVLLGSAVLVVLYGGVQLAVTHVLGAATGSSENAFTATVQRGLGPAAGTAVAWIVLVSTLGALHGVTFAASRIGYAMARDGAFFRAFYKVHPTFQTPARSVIALSAAAIVYVLATGFRELVFHFSFNVWLFYAATAICLLRLRRWGRGEPLAWRAPGGALAPAIVLLTAAGISGSLFVQSPKQAAIGLVLLLSGFPVWALWRWARGRATVPMDAPPQEH